MAPTPRHSTAPRGPPRGPSRAPTTTVPIPPYQPPTAPLSPAHIHALSTLRIKHPLDPLHSHLQRATQLLSEVAADLNEVSAHRSASVAHKRAVRAQKLESLGPESEEAGQGQGQGQGLGLVPGEEAARELAAKVEELTGLMEEKVRRVIDLRAGVEAGERGLEGVRGKVEEGGGRVEWEGDRGVGESQSTLGASQFRSRRGRDEEEDGESGDEERPGVGVVRALKRKAEEHEERYGALSMAERYARHNDYIGFKNFVHDAQHPGEEKPPLPHASTWFSDGGAVEAGAMAGADEEESDIEAVTERVSIKCPLTLLPMKDPVTSKKCPHSFEKDAILEMITHSSLRIGGDGRRGGRGGTAAIKCPVCEIVLTTQDLTPDPALKRKIAAIQAHKKRQEEEGLDEDDTMHGNSRPRPEEVESGDEGAASRRSTARNIKAERFSSVVPSTLAQANHDDDDDEQEDEEDEDEEEEDEEENEEEDEEDQDVRQPSHKQSEPPKSSAMIVDMEDEDEDEDEEDDSALYE